MSHKHTKGPWQVVKRNAPFGVHETNRFVSYRLEQEGLTTDAHFTDENDANADLIEAAPEMLDALEDIVGQIELADHLGDVDWDQAKEAITKALGEHRDEK